MNTKNKPFIIGIAGSARTGKDLVSNLLIRELHYKHSIMARRIAFADQMKKDAESFLLKYCQLDIWNDADKVKARPFLIWYGSVFMREKSKGQHWINCIKKKINACSSQNDFFIPPHKNIFIISDLRFKEYEYDELDYIKENGIVLYVDKFHVTNNPLSTTPVKIYTQPANDYEARNNVILKKESNYQISWEDCNGDIDKINEICLPHIQNFIGWLKNQGFLKT